MEDKSLIDDIINSMNHQLKNLHIDNNIESLDNIEDKLDNDIEILINAKNYLKKMKILKEKEKKTSTISKKNKQYKHYYLLILVSIIWKMNSVLAENQ